MTYARWPIAQTLKQFKKDLRTVFGKWPKLKESTFTGKSKPATFICKCGQEMPYAMANDIFPKPWTEWKSGKLGKYHKKCSTCQAVITSDIKRASLREVRDIAKTKSVKLTVLSLTQNGGATWVNYKCECGNEASTVFNRFKSQETVCKPCSSKLYGARQLSQAEATIGQRLKERTNGRCILVGPYLGTYGVTQFQCTKCKSIFDQSINNVLHNCQWCESCFPRKGSRSWSIACVEWLDYLAAKYNITIEHAGNTGERRLQLKNGKVLVDGFCEELNLCFEFHGTVWHGDPRSTKPHPYGIPNEDVYRWTKQKERAIRAAGYNLVTLWEIDYWNSSWDDLYIPDRYLKQAR